MYVNVPRPTKVPIGQGEYAINVKENQKVALKMVSFEVIDVFLFLIKIVQLKFYEKNTKKPFLKNISGINFNWKIVVIVKKLFSL